MLHRVQRLIPPAPAATITRAWKENILDPAVKPRSHSDQRRFVRQVAAFWTPVVVVLVILELILWNSGETWPVERVLQTQASRPRALFLRRYLGQAFYRYKFK